MSNKTLIIYDIDGVVIQQITGLYNTPNGVPFIEVIIPTGKYVAFIDIETKEPVYRDIPKTQVELLEDKISILNAENIELRKELNQIKTSIASLIATTIEK